MAITNSTRRPKLQMELCHAISAPQKHCEVIPDYGHGTIPNEIILDRMAQYIHPLVAR